MSIDFQQVQGQVRQLGENAPQRAEQLLVQRSLAHSQLARYALDLETVRQKVALAVKVDQTLRCALPVMEALNLSGLLPPLLPRFTLIAADGSQIEPNRHADITYCLINVGAIQMCHGVDEPPATKVSSQLFYDDQLYTETGTITETTLALRRDLNERKMLAELARQVQGPVLTFTDGPMELWGAKDANGASEFQERLSEYQAVLHELCELNTATAGYVDKPAANLVVRLLEVLLTPEEDLKDLSKLHPLRGVLDIDLYHQILGPGERSAVFAIQSKSAGLYRDELALHFFYLNVGRPGHPWLARVEIPRWVAENQQMLDQLHAALVAQCRMLGSRPYPYLLHRAHETAVVTLEEQEQVTQMIAIELRRRGVNVGDGSYKQDLKDLPGRTRLSA